MTTATAEQTHRIEDMDPKDLEPKGKSAGLVCVDDSDFSTLLDTSRFEQLYRIAQLYSRTKLIPEHFQGKPEDCMIVLQMAMRLNVDPMPMLQGMYVVHGKPGMEAKLAIGLINTSGLFQNSLDYEVDGDDPKEKDYRVRAFAVSRATGKRINGPWIDWPMVKAEGWDGKSGSKWKTMPGLMFQYRAGMFFGRLHCPERLMGMQTVDELQDVGPGTRVVDSTPVDQPRSQSLSKRLQGKQEVIDTDATPADQASPDIEEMPEPTPREQCIVFLMERDDLEAQDAESELDETAILKIGKPFADLNDAEYVKLLGMVKQQTAGN